MDSYQVELTRTAEKDIRRLDRQFVPRIFEVIEGLAKEPRPVGFKKLTGSENTYRVRVGNYRVIYEIEDNRLLVLVIRVKHRKDAYR